jgi:hypothetical protein
MRTVRCPSADTLSRTPSHCTTMTKTTMMFSAEEKDESYSTVRRADGTCSGVNKCYLHPPSKTSS